MRPGMAAFCCANLIVFLFYEGCAAFRIGFSEPEWYTHVMAAGIWITAFLVVRMAIIREPSK